MIATTLTKNNLQVPLTREGSYRFPPDASSSKTKTDDDLAREAAGGDTYAFEEIVRRRREGLVRFLTSFTQSAVDAEDLAQETFLRAYRNLSRYDPRKPFLTWLYVIARRLAINFNRNRSRRGENQLSDTDSCEKEYATGNDLSSLWASTRKILSPDAFRAFRLHYADGMPLKEIAEVLGKTTTGTKVLLFRARRNLADKIDPHTYEPINS